MVEAVHAARLNTTAAATVRGRDTTARPSRRRRPSSTMRGQRSRSAPTRSAPGRRCAATASAEPDHEQGHERATEQDRARHDPARAQDDHGQGGDADDHDRVDDPLDDDRAQDRRPADALALPEGVDADELPEARRQHAVGEIPEVRVAEDPPVRHRDDRRQQRLPAQRPEGDVRDRRDDHHPDPGRRRGAEHIGGRGEVDRAQDEPARDDADADAERAPDERAGTDPHEGATRLVRAVAGDAACASAGRAAGGACSGPRHAGSRARRRCSAGGRPTRPPRSSGSAPRSRRSAPPCRPPPPGRRAPGRTRSRPS